MTDGTPAEVGPFTDVDAPPGAGPTVTLLNGSCFCVSDRGGDLSPDVAHGLFVRDTRILSRWQVLVSGRPTVPLSAQQVEPFAAAFIARVPPDEGRADSALVLVRRRRLSEGMLEEIAVTNHTSAVVEIDVEALFDADLADLFEVKEGRAHPAATQREITPAGAVRIRRGGHGVLFDFEPAGTPTRGGEHWRVELPPRGTWSVTARIAPIVDGLPLLIDDAIADDLAAQRLRDWRTESPKVETKDPVLAGILQRSHDDLGTLRIFSAHDPDRAVVAAGAPWFMALFGRDSLLTSWMTLPVDARLAISTLQTLAEHQGRTDDPASEEEPGRIPHEVRFGPAAPIAFGERNAYFGTADATSLFVALFGELRRWGHDGPEMRALIPAVDRALEWIVGRAERNGHGYVDYARPNDHGLANQGWKDSWDGINFADGRIADVPIALAEVQGYTYAAYLARAELARDLDDPQAEMLWRARAIALRAAFNTEFWLPEHGWFAVGLDGHGQRIDALTSNIGHCLWSGIVDEDKAAVLVERFTSPEMFTGWGLRTLAGSMGAYNPVSYHNGTVWPHDTAICVAGLMRYGFVEQAQRVASGLLEAARRFDDRLPELFCGFPREDFPNPVAYPTSCWPQAWASAAPLLVLRALLRFDPEINEGRIWCAPVVPERYLPLTIRDAVLGERIVSLTVDADGVRLEGDPRVTLLRIPRPPSASGVLTESPIEGRRRSR